MANEQSTLIGQVFGRLTVLSYHHTSKRKTYFLCQCACDNQTVVARSNIKSGHTRSCGCLQTLTPTKHGHTPGKQRSPEYSAWTAMISRCCNPKNTHFQAYGGRGIAVCERWRNSFTDFLADMGPKRDPSLTLEREDNEKGYEPSNVKWATRADQMRNTRRTHLVTISGETHCLTDWATIIGISPRALADRIRKWPDSRLLAPSCRTFRKAVNNGSAE